MILDAAGKRSSLQPFIPNGKAVSIPKKRLHTVALSVEKNKKRTGQQLSREEPLYDSAESLKTLVHADRIFAKEDAGRQCQHDASANRAKICLRKLRSQSLPMRM
jgi:hypothetical protein